MNSSVPRAADSARRGRPVDRVAVVARHVRPRAGDVGADAAPAAADRAEGQPEQPTPRDEGKGGVADCSRSASLVSDSKTRRTAAALPRRQSSRNVGERASQPTRAASASVFGVNTTRWPSTGRNRCSTSTGVTYAGRAAAPSARAARSSARLPRTDAPTATAGESRVARTSSTIQRASSGSR